MDTFNSNVSYGHELKAGKAGKTPHQHYFREDAYDRPVWVAPCKIAYDTAVEAQALSLMSYARTTLRQQDSVATLSGSGLTRRDSSSRSCSESAPLDPSLLASIAEV